MRRPKPAETGTDHVSVAKRKNSASDVSLRTSLSRSAILAGFTFGAVGKMREAAWQCPHEKRLGGDQFLTTLAAVHLANHILANAGQDKITGSSLVKPRLRRCAQRARLSEAAPRSAEPSVICVLFMPTAQ